MITYKSNLNIKSNIIWHKKKSNQINLLVEFIVVSVRVVCELYILREIVSLGRKR